MKAYFLNFKYYFKHRWHVLKAGLKLRVPIHQLILHDWHKLLPDEFIAYTRHFYGETGSAAIQDRWKAQFNRAWLKHVHRAPHHPQHWQLQNDDGTVELLKMPQRFVKEMVADWSGAGAAQGRGDNPTEWYVNHAQHKMHPESRAYAEALMKETWPETAHLFYEKTSHRFDALHPDKFVIGHDNLVYGKSVLKVSEPLTTRKRHPAKSYIKDVDDDAWFNPRKFRKGDTVALTDDFVDDSGEGYRAGMIGEVTDVLGGLPLSVIVEFPHKPEVTISELMLRSAEGD